MFLCSVCSIYRFVLGLTENNLSRQRGAAVSAVEWILEPSLVSIITSTLGPLYDEMKKIPNLHGEIAIDTGKVKVEYKVLWTTTISNYQSFSM